MADTKTTLVRWIVQVHAFTGDWFFLPQSVSIIGFYQPGERGDMASAIEALTQPPLLFYSARENDDAPKWRATIKVLLPGEALPPGVQVLRVQRDGVLAVVPV